MKESKESWIEEHKKQREALMPQYQTIDHWEMRGRYMYINGHVFDRKVRSFNYDASKDLDLIEVDCYKEDERGVIIDGDEPMIETFIFVLGRNGDV